MESPGSGSGGGALILLTGAALLMFRPKELPILARASGRLVGAGVRGLRRVRESALSVASEAESSGTRTRLSTAIRSVDTIVGKLRSEVAPLGFNARAYAAGTQMSGRSKHNQTGQGDQAPRGKSGQHSEDAVGQRGLADALTIERYDISKVIKGTSVLSEQTKASIEDKEGSGETGSDVMASVVEEAAFAEQHSKIVGSSTKEDG